MSASNDTICAIATPPGRGGVGVIRISGPDAFELARRLSARAPEARRFFLADLRDDQGEVIDQALVLGFRGPASFTGEDVVELQTHGSPVVLEMLLERLVRLGARRARPGEFSERAYLNDRMDLAQAEAIADLIAAGTAQAARAASRSLEGVFSRLVDALHHDLVELRVWVEAALDFPDEDVDFLADGQVAARLDALRTRLDELIEQARAGRLLNDGLRVAIIGKPNAGKSSLLNAMTRRDSAIVTDIPGTTRDVLRETIELGGLPVTLADTAGLRDTEDRVEIEGVRRAEREMHAADLLFWVVDIEDEAAHLPPGLPPELPFIRINNKIDRVGREPRREGRSVDLSALEGRGLDLLEQAVREVLGLQSDGGGEFSARQRHIDALVKAREPLDRGARELAATGSGELLAEELRMAAEALAEITGRMSSDELLGHIFSSFCIGK
ncbi:tRNA modification GTPase [Wenzhouxiangella marina]|uniref:tRNA uridine-5-carboxymethylaminomethyl(34) synthesis GTPase MnmE n=1 Tax=Wenzhouxiangella marina TaxID=1579979 RepID=UPI0012E1D16F|nr:tRNA uridine-5-carboxymethylaminomethyl(34) synthesis GTPase MnmE [Wenzhouxiangella marina]MBB6088290.1 tRNA modification GTPase [Wenzhouxiangella marina]